MAATNKIDLSGQNFGRWRVIKEVNARNKGRVMFLCKCECGNMKEVASVYLRNGESRSCGCFFKEQTVKRNTKHGMAKRGTRHRLYGVWKNMKQRCYDPNVEGYAYYGGRGIIVCKEWRESFIAFHDYAVNLPGYSRNVEIDRIDNDGNYEPGNVRWSTKLVQMNNRSNNHIVTINGKSYTLAEAVRKFSKLPYEAVKMRLRRGWPLKEAFLLPIGGRSNDS